MEVIDIQNLTNKLMAIRSSMIHREDEFQEVIAGLHPIHRDSARNLIRYLHLRTFELRSIQEQLSCLGLSSIGHSERYTLANVENILYFLHLHQGIPFKGRFNLGEHPVNFVKSYDILQENANRLLGNSNRKLNTRIMVTLPSEAADDYTLVENLVASGMDNARINCSHDGPDQWQHMIHNIRKAEAATGHKCLVYMDLAGPKLRTGPIELKQVPFKKKAQDFIFLKKGDKLKLHRNRLIGRNASRDDQGLIIEPARLSPTIPSVMDDIKLNQRIWFDDGTIGGKIIDVNEDFAEVIITHANSKGSKLKAEKGINLPDTQLDLPPLTEEDLSYLPFVVENADTVGYSFVRTPEDVEVLQKELERLGRPDIGIVLKIETKEAFQNLPSLLLQGMKSPSLGVMIARGDLAVEMDYERISEVQEEIMWICEAAFIPIIWATQVLEKLAKKGTASRAEVTDAAKSAQSECVMLNKGEYILEAMHTLSNILQRMEAHHQKKKGTLRSLTVAREFFKERPRLVNA
jgi:pyruvate kinase